MLIAHVEMNLEEHIVVVASRVIEIVKNEKEIVFESLVKEFLRKNKNYSPDQFIDACIFLYAIGGLSIKNSKVEINNV